jgi:hypothetical protein
MPKLVHDLLATAVDPHCAPYGDAEAAATSTDWAVRVPCGP